MNKNKTVKILIFLGLVLVFPKISLAIDLNKGLQETSENYSNIGKFLKGGAGFKQAPTDKSPSSLFNLMATNSTKSTLSTDKEDYRAGETVNVHFTASNPGFSSEGYHSFYLWSQGNFFVDLVRLSPDVDYGEFLIASGKAFAKDNLSLFRNQNKEFDFSYQIPEDLKTGQYELRVYPESNGIQFYGAPVNGRTLLKTRINIQNDKEKECLLSWDISKISLDGKNILLKDQVFYINPGVSHSLSIPLKNNYDKNVDISVAKLVRSLNQPPGNLLNGKDEDMSLNPGEEKTVDFNFGDSELENEPLVWIELAFVTNRDNQKIVNRNYFDFPISGFSGEGVLVPIFIKGKVSSYIDGMALVKKDFSALNQENSEFTYLLEVKRMDPLFFWSSSTNRGKETNIKLNLSLQDQNGNHIDEIGYDGPSWDKSGMIYKKISLDKDYHYLKLTGTLENLDGSGRVYKNEVNYDFTEGDTGNNGLFKNLLGWIKKMSTREKIIYSTIVVVTVLLLLAIILIKTLLKREKEKGESRSPK